MKRLCIPALMALFVSCSTHTDDNHAAEAAEKEGHHHDDLIELAEEQAQRFGVKADTVRPGEFATVIRASGVVERATDNASTATAPLAGIVRFGRNISLGAPINRGADIATIDPSAVSGGDNNRAAKAALEAARREVERLTPLYNDKLVTAADYNAAVAALEAARAAYAPSASGGRVPAPISGVITSLSVADGAYVNAGDPIATVSGDRNLTLHAEVAADQYQLLSGVTDARIGSFTLSEHSGRKTGVSAENGYACVFFNFDGSGFIAPGSGVDVYLLAEPRFDVISLPLDAVVEQQGDYFVYLRHSPGHYVKVPVTLGSSDGRRVEITSGLNGGEVVVTSSAMTVRLAENSGTVPEGHSHNH